MTDDILGPFLVNAWDGMAMGERDGLTWIGLTIQDIEGRLISLAFPVEAMEKIIPEMNHAVAAARARTSQNSDAPPISIETRRTAVGKKRGDAGVVVMLEVDDQTSYATVLTHSAAVELRDNLTKVIQGNLHDERKTKN